MAGKIGVIYRMRLLEEKLLSGRPYHNSFANKRRYAAMETDLAFKSYMSKEHLIVIRYVQPMKDSKFRPSSFHGVTWNHALDSPSGYSPDGKPQFGVMQLVIANDHSKSTNLYHIDGFIGFKRWGE